MKLLCFSDLHLSNRNSKFHRQDGVSDLLRLQEKFVNWVCEKAVDEDYDVILFLGDWTDYPTLDPVTLSYSNRLVARLAETQKPVIFLEGNHCITDKGNKHTVVGATSEIISPESPIWFVFQNEVVQIGDFNFYCIPYSSNYKQIEEDIATINNSIDGPSILLFHLPSINAVLDNGVQSVKGVNVSDEITSNFLICLGGDFHKPQQLVNNPRAWYVGAPFDLNFGDHYDGRGVLSVDVTEEGIQKVEMVEHPYTFPIMRVTYDEILEMDDTELKNGVYKVDGEITDEQRAKLLNIKDKAYRLDISKPKFTSVAKMDGVNLVASVGRGKDKELIKNRMSSLNVSDEQQDRIMSLFSKFER